MTTMTGPGTAPESAHGADPTLEDLFGPVISAYTRAQAIEDGELVDVTATAREAGYRCPVALTRGAFTRAVDLSGWDARRRHRDGQDEAGRLWDVLWMSKVMRRNGEGSRQPFALMVRDMDGRIRRVALHLHVGPGDDGAPVVTILLPEED